MRWRVERATLRDGWSTFLVINDTTFEPLPEAMGFTVAMDSAEKSPNTIRAYARGVAVFRLFRFQSALIAPRSPPEWISDRKM
jgi:hypothetical protein